MNTLNQMTLLLFCMAFCNFSNAQMGDDQKRRPIVVIDPGHGGKDPGATTRTGIKEKDIALGVAENMVILNKMLFDSSLELFLTRYSDTLIALGDRAKLSKQLKADIFISIHCNQALNHNASGTEVYILPKSEVHGKKSAYLGYTIQKKLSGVLGIKNRGIKYGNFQVLRDNHQSSASILLELGFLSQTDEANYLTKEDAQIAIAMAILQSIFKFLELS
ncbi:N-acetylmuramoyl-L-alanine amidase [Tamlana sp. 2_MG-2023]|uniref:N-acetylmuramoyl-L-alanine amidase family protein n=1 Tax=unclassified Tamlana TaxID=2614803 RepID=UPI0026E34F41|nr:MULTISPECIES: N-acetylmuramoyl-L-alanine amidase [unclassified Tamlana]MDO6761630.1 N-acetylmuramoyl-L-alanine amidase [Tamlana sp. 2_MG-2023]MDO6792456.1 N-acetylmuramoyl-L-alanine amidase [Tamlana sp. 1_MG-2023]